MLKIRGHVLPRADGDLSVICLSGKGWVRLALPEPNKFHVKASPPSISQTLLLGGRKDVGKCKSGTSQGL